MAELPKEAELTPERHAYAERRLDELKQMRRRSLRRTCIGVIAIGLTAYALILLLRKVSLGYALYPPKPLEALRSTPATCRTLMIDMYGALRFPASVPPYLDEGELPWLAVCEETATQEEATEFLRSPLVRHRLKARDWYGVYTAFTTSDGEELEAIIAWARVSGDRLARVELVATAGDDPVEVAHQRFGFDVAGLEEVGPGRIFGCISVIAGLTVVGLMIRTELCHVFAVNRIGMCASCRYPLWEREPEGCPECGHGRNSHRNF